MSISIIVPVYNAESTLRRCVDSILRQAFTDFECLLIDDGSTDKSGDICEGYAAMDSRVKVFHKENGGVSSARNVGLKNATGEWVTFVDSDDYVDAGFLIAIPDEYDLIFLSATMQNETGNESKNLSLYPGYVVSKRKFCQEHLSDLILRVPWAKLIRKRIVYELYFEPRMRIGEDTCFMLDVLSRTNRICVVDSGRYVYFDSCRFSKFQLTYKEAAYNVTSIIRHYRQIEISCVSFEFFIYEFFLSLVRDDKWWNYVYWGMCKPVRDLYMKTIASRYSSKLRAKFAFSPIGFFLKHLLPKRIQS